MNLIKFWAYMLFLLGIWVGLFVAFELVAAGMGAR
jgi:hypothetical protein